MARPKFIGKQLARVIREARAAADDGQREMCGLLVDTGFFLDLIPIRNRARRPGRFVFDARQVRAVGAALKQANRIIAGTWHSHPLATAQPGPGDIAAAVEGDLMLIVDCTGRKAKLWRIRKGAARAVPFRVIEI
jgi:proteasome lid subunit RPN8/RPN11